MRRLKKVACVLVAIVALGVGFFLYIFTAPSESSIPTQDPVPIVKDKQAIVYEYPPYYKQYDERWASVPYANGTIETSGCGLCAAASYISFATQSEITPADLEAAVGSTCTVNGVNDMAIFLDYFEYYYGTTHSDIFWTKDEAYARLDEGYLLFAGVEGQIGPNNYAGHVVLLWKQYGRINVMDPASDNLGGLADEEFYNADFTYFYWMEGSSVVEFLN